ncbi:MAG: hypothetical protein HQL48_11930, partial [Gammaproteobacteria bacterium]|nr:hypothetical protein [Gammaproteobacteria bacterium]
MKVPSLLLSRLILPLLSLSGCATSSLFTPYPQQLSPVKIAVEQGQLTAAKKGLGG